MLPDNHQHPRATRPCRLSEYGYIIGVAAERRDILLHPLECGNLVKESQIPVVGYFGYAMLVKLYGNDRESETRYSPAECIGCRAISVIGKPDAKHISTSFVERQNWSVRTAMRRYTRLSNGFSRKIENHAAAIALNYFAYNFIKIHRTLRMSPAMAAAVTDHLGTLAN